MKLIRWCKMAHFELPKVKFYYYVGDCWHFLDYVMLEICAGIKLCVYVSFEVQQILCDFYLCVFGLDLIQIK